MSNTLGIDFAADQDEASGDMPSVLVYKGASITGSRGAFMRSRDVAADMVVGGEINPLDLPWIGAVADFTGVLPAEGDTVAIGGTNYHVNASTYNEDDTVVRLDVRRI